MCVFVLFVVVCKQRTAYEMRISDWSSDVCSSDLAQILAVAAEVGIGQRPLVEHLEEAAQAAAELHVGPAGLADGRLIEPVALGDEGGFGRAQAVAGGRLGIEELRIAAGRALAGLLGAHGGGEGDLGEGAGHDLAPLTAGDGARMPSSIPRSGEHTSALRSLMSISYAGF